MASDAKAKTAAQSRNAEPTGDEILRELGFDPDTLALDVAGSVEEMGDAIARRVETSLRAQGWSPKDLELTDEEWEKKHGTER